MPVATENAVTGSKARAYRITSDQEAIRIAKELRRSFAADAARRDEKRILPVSEIEEFSHSGLWAITVPRTYGGAEVSVRWPWSRAGPVSTLANTEETNVWNTLRTTRSSRQPSR